MERAGIPTAYIMTSAFTETVLATARSIGAEDYPFVTLPHPISILKGEELDHCATVALDAVIPILIRAN